MTPSDRFKAPAPPGEPGPLDGVLLVEKPAGPTSHDVVARIRSTFRIKKVGHGGTLDPRATGLLIILLGRGTKLSDSFLSSDKAYEGVLRLGIETDSYDADGDVVRESDWSGVTEEALRSEMKKLTGDQLQTPPMVSAVKVAGVPLYKHARKGREVKRDPRLIRVYEFSLSSFDPPRAGFRVRCTKGTYVRSLCADVGTALGCGAHLEELVRTQCGEFVRADAHPLDEILAWDRHVLAEHVLPVGRFATSGRRPLS